MSQQAEPNWIVVIKTAGVMEAEMIAGRLQSLGIPALVQNEPLGAVLGLSIGALGEARVMVPEAFFTQASAILDDPDAETAYDDDAPLLESGKDNDGDNGDAG